VLARSKSAKVPDSCGSVRNKSSALSKNAWAEHCKSAAAEKSCGCCYRTMYHAAFAAAAHKSARCCWNTLADCCRSSVLKAAMLGHLFPEFALLRVTMADDSRRCHGPIAPGNYPACWSFQNLPADGPDRWRCPALPKCVSFCLPFANQRCPQHLRNCGSSCSWPRAACYSTAPAGENSSQMTAWSCPGGRSLPANCVLAPRRCAPGSSQSY